MSLLDPSNHFRCTLYVLALLVLMIMFLSFSFSSYFCNFPIQRLIQIHPHFISPITSPNLLYGGRQRSGRRYTSWTKVEVQSITVRHRFLLNRVKKCIERFI
jgi:hypothetical protein